MPARFAEWLARVQNDLLDVGADLSVSPRDSADEARERLRVTPDYTAWLEQACDEVNEKLPPLRSFVIPGGTPRGRAPARLPHRLPSRGAPHDRGRGREPRGGALPQPPLGPALHPQPRCERERRRAPVGARRARRRREAPSRTRGAGGKTRSEARSAATASAVQNDATSRPPTTSLGMCQASTSRRHAHGQRRKGRRGRPRPGAAAAGATSTAHRASAIAAVEWPLGHEAALIGT